MLWLEMGEKPSKRLRNVEGWRWDGSGCRPTVVLLRLSSYCELTPTINLLHTALAAVFFDAVGQMA